jgi:hypothetical protein
MFLIMKDQPNMIFRSARYGNCLLIILIFFTAIIYPSIGPDGGYYLSIARDFYQGKSDIYNMIVGYNPLAILILGLPYSLSDGNPYEFSVLILLLVHVINTILFYQILKKLKIRPLYIKLFASFFLLYSLLLDGTFIVLEPVQILFLLSATLFLLNNNFFLSGAFVFLAFYSKQYSLAFLAGLLIYIILDNVSVRKKILNLFCFAFGFGIMLTLFYFLLAKNIKFPQYLLNLAGFGGINAIDFKHATGVGYNFSVFLKNIVWVIIIAPVMFLWIVYLKDIKINKITGFLLGNIIGFSAVFLFASYFHYFILFIPWCLLLTSALITESGEKLKINFNIILFSLAFISVLFFTFKNIRNRIIIYNREMEVKENIATVILPGSKVFIYGASPAQYIYSSLKSANPHELGYMFPNLYDLSYYLGKMDEKSLILLQARDGEKVANNKDFEFLAETKQYSVFKKKGKQE